jgi:hypothetical protein
MFSFSAPAVRDVEANTAAALPNFSAEEKVSLSRAHWMLRFLYITVGALLMGCAIYTIQLDSALLNVSITNSDAAPLVKEAWATTFISCYVFAFAIFICCFEIGVSMINRCMSENFGFLYSITGRYVFMCMIAGLCVKMYIYGYVMVAVIAVALLIHTILLVMNPRLGQYIKELHYNAGK